MAYLLYMDALGMQNHYNNDFNIANSIMDRIHKNAVTAFSSHLPELGSPLKSLPGSSITIMNDSVFIHANDLKYLIYVCAKFAKMMFLPTENQPPIAFRGSIAVTKNAPKLKFSENGNLTFSKLVVDNISAALIADKKQVVGARILIPKKILDLKVMEAWPIRFQSLVIDVKTSIKSTSTDVLKQGFEDYYDLAWMIAEEEGVSAKIKKNLYEYWLKSIYNSRAALHASATMLLFEACNNKRTAVHTVLKTIGIGLVKAGKLEIDQPKKLKYQDWINLSKTIKELRGGALFLPPSEQSPILQHE